jgi:hypothetical protein
MYDVTDAVNVGIKLLNMGRSGTNNSQTGDLVENIEILLRVWFAYSSYDVSSKIILTYPD